MAEQVKKQFFQPEFCYQLIISTKKDKGIFLDKWKLLLYLKEDKTEDNEERLLLIQDLFLPIGYDLRVFWKYHFGIIGVEDAMRIDETAIY